MVRQTTIDKLHELRLSIMAEAFETQCNDQSFNSLPFEDRFGMLIDKEWDKRKSNKLQKMIKTADFRYPNACMEDRVSCRPKFGQISISAAFYLSIYI